MSYYDDLINKFSSGNASQNGMLNMGGNSAGGVTGMMGTGGSSSGGVSGVGSLSSYMSPGTYNPTTEFGKSAITNNDSFSNSSNATKDFDIEKLLSALQTGTKKEEAQAPQLRQIGGGSRFDQSQYKNPLLERDIKQMYSSPTYRKLA